MVKRIKKPAVEPDKRREWLKRHEEGESPPQIAKADVFDVRTVRTHIELAKEEREVKEAKATVLRNAMQDHYHDLCEYAEKLSVQARGESAAESPREKHIHSALHQHLPRSPIWNYLKQREALTQQIDLFRQQADMKVEEMVKSDQQLSSRPDLKKIVVTGIIDALKAQLSEWAQGRQGLIINDSYFEQGAGEFVNLHYGAAFLGKIGRASCRERV